MPSETVDCKKGYATGSSSACYYFYSQLSCLRTSCIARYNAGNIKIDSASINVEYFADGSEPANIKKNDMYGFRMKYEYVNCGPAGKCRLWSLSISQIFYLFYYAINPSTATRYFVHTSFNCLIKKKISR